MSWGNTWQKASSTGREQKHLHTNSPGGIRLIIKPMGILFDVWLYSHKNCFVVRKGSRENILRKLRLEPQTVIFICCLFQFVFSPNKFPSFSVFITTRSHQGNQYQPGWAMTITFFLWDMWCSSITQESNLWSCIHMFITVLGRQEPFNKCNIRLRNLSCFCGLALGKEDLQMFFSG